MKTFKLKMFVDMLKAGNEPKQCVGPDDVLVCVNGHSHLKELVIMFILICAFTVCVCVCLCLTRP